MFAKNSGVGALKRMTTMVGLDAGMWADPPVIRIGGMHILATVVMMVVVLTGTMKSSAGQLVVFYIQQTVRTTSDWFSCRTASKTMVIDG